MMRRGWVGGLAVVLAGFALGCGKGSGEEQFFPVTGKVIYKGEPLKTGTVIFVADTVKGNKTQHEPRGPIDDQGHYEVSTAGRPGAPPGSYKVAIIPNKRIDPAKLYAIPESLLPKKYTSAKTSELALEVTEKSADGAYDLVLK